MFGQPYRRSTDDENSDNESTSALSDATSRATANESWHDVKSDNEQEKLIQLENIQNTRVKEKVSDSGDDNDDDEDEEDKSLIKSIDDIYVNGSVKKTVTNEEESESESDDNSVHDQQKQQTDNSLNNTHAVVYTKLAAIDDSSTNTTDSQGKNINPAGNNSLTALNPSEETSSISTNSKQNTVNNLQNEQTKVLSNNNDPKTSILNQQQTPTSTIEEVKSWINPYWPTSKKDDNEQSTEKIKDSDSSKTAISADNNNLNKNQDSSSTLKKTDAQLPTDSTKNSWVNPYWGTKSISRAFSAPYGEQSKVSSTQVTTNVNLNSDKSQDSRNVKKENVQWENPYWKNKASTAPNTPKPQEKSWENPYWKDKVPTTPSSAKPQDKSWENPYWKDKVPITPTTPKPQEKSPIPSDQKDKPLSSTTPNTPKPQDKCWENPYWKDKVPTTPSSAKPQDKSWKNPYWKDKVPITPTTPKPQEKSSIPSHQKDKPLSSTTPNTPKPQDKSWENPYWKDKMPTTPSSAKPQEKPWENPYWKNGKTSSVVPISTFETTTKGGKKNIVNNIWTLDNESPPDHKVPPIPSFYQRIYPKQSSRSSPRQGESNGKNNLTNVNHSTKPISSQLYNHFSDDNDELDALPYTNDGDGVVRYRALPPSSSISSSKRVSLTTEAPKSQNIARALTRNGAPSSQQNNSTISALISPNVTKPPENTNKTSSPSLPNLEPLQSLNFINRLSSEKESPIFVIHFDELCDIQNALRTVETRSGNIPTIESYQDKSLNYKNNVTIPYAGYDSPIKVDDFRPYQSPENPPPQSSYPTNNSSNPQDSLARFMKNGPAVHI